MYQPRRVADPIAPAEAPLPAEVSRSTPVEPRRFAPTLADKIFARGGVALAVLTVSATAGAVLVGSIGAQAVALGSSTQGVVPVTEVPSVSAQPAASAAVRTLTANELAKPAAAISAKKAASQLMVSLTRKYTTGSLNVRAEADVESKLLGRVETGVRVSATTEIDGKYRKVEYEDGFGWVLVAELSDAASVEAAGTTMAPCSRGSAVERRLRKDTIRIHRSVCALFPAVNSYGGWRAGGMAFHKNGRALDIMLTPRAESALGHRIANYLIKHAAEFNVDHIIFEQQIWTPRSPHWRHMAGRGSITANHFNHVHVAIRA